jgi:ADP-ribose pyrophosphatase YjhB (NUDIX family)
MQAAPIAVGAAIVTTAGQLPAKHVIHVPTMEEPGMKIGAENVRRAARAALIAADRNHFKVIAMPGIGTDLGEVPVDEAARAIVEEIRAHVGATSLHYLTLAGLQESTHLPESRFCRACFTCDYPIEVPDELALTKLRFEGEKNAPGSLIDSATYSCAV